jgi:hypothetical protein
LLTANGLTALLRCGVTVFANKEFFSEEGIFTMPNMNTIAYQQAGAQQNGIAPNTNAQTTTETAVVLSANPFAAALGIPGGGGAVPLSVPATSGTLQGSSTATGIWQNGRPFQLKAYGTITTGTNTNVTLKLYQVPASVVAAGTAGTLANDNLLNSSGAQAVNTTSTNFEMTAELQWDSVSKKLTGTVKWSLGGALVAEAEITVLTTATASELELNFLLSTTFSAGNAANVIQVQYFEMLQ